jgi:hypothetical protein
MLPLILPAPPVTLATCESAAFSTAGGSFPAQALHWKALNCLFDLRNLSRLRLSEAFLMPNGTLRWGAKVERGSEGGRYHRCKAGY